MFSNFLAHYHARFSKAISREIRAGHFRYDLNADDAACLVLAPIQGRAMRRSLNNREFDLQTAGEGLLKTQFQAFRKAPKTQQGNALKRDNFPPRNPSSKRL